MIQRVTKSATCASIAERICSWHFRFVFWLMLLGSDVFAAEPVFMDFTNTPPAAIEPLPESPRELFNLGTRKLRQGKLQDSEALFLKALESQDEKVQSPALYNLGHNRFAQGAEQLKKSAAAGPSSARGRRAAQQADTAAAIAREALASDDLQKMLAAYMNGRGARRDLKDATKVVRRALNLHESALRQWRRSLGDFKSAAELNPSDTNATHNAALVEREIARLVDSIREMQQTAQMMGQSQQELKEQMKQLGGRIPEPMMPPGASGEDEEEEEGKNGKEQSSQPKEGQQEAPSKDGEEMTMSPEEAGWLLDGFKLDSDRRLPMGRGDTPLPQDRKSRNW